MRTGDGPNEPAFSVLLNQRKSPPGMAVPLKFELIELSPGSACCSSGIARLTRGVMCRPAGCSHTFLSELAACRFCRPTDERRALLAEDNCSNRRSLFMSPARSCNPNGNSAAQEIVGPKMRAQIKRIAMRPRREILEPVLSNCTHEKALFRTKKSFPLLFQQCGTPSIVKKTVLLLEAGHGFHYNLDLS